MKTEYFFCQNNDDLRLRYFRRREDAVLGGDTTCACRATSVPDFRAAIDAFLGDGVSTEAWLQWGHVATSAACVLWDWKSWNALTVKYVELARLAGVVGDDDFGTSVSFGLFPQLYNTLGFLGVFSIGLVTVALVFWWFRCFIGDHDQLTFYALMLLGLVQHDIAEGILASFLGMAYAPIYIIMASLPHGLRP